MLLRVRKAVTRLQRTARGRLVCADLHRFLNGEVCGLSLDGWDTVDYLLASARGGYRCAVIEALLPPSSETDNSGSEQPR